MANKYTRAIFLSMNCEKWFVKSLVITFSSPDIHLRENAMTNDLGRYFNPNEICQPF